MSEQTLTTLSRLDAKTLQDFIYQVDHWQAQHGDKADNIEIVYHADDDDFEIITNDKPTKKGRINALTAEILAWANGQLKQLQGWNHDKTVTAFTCVYKNDEFGVAVSVQDKTSQASESETGSGSLGD